MEPTSRRQFLKRSSAVAAAAGVVAAVPAGAASALQTHAESRLPDDETVDVPVVAHVRDVRKGLVSLYTGDKEVVVKNKRLAAALYHATR
jgi:anaerobic selenocysteine-containing dehydrogenase